MQAALGILSITCWHSFFLFSNVAHCAMWDDALDAKFYGKGKLCTKTEWDPLLGHWGAISDVPAICFAEELQEVYPEAKVVLVERDLERWYKSFNDAVIANVWNPVMEVVRRLDPWLVGPLWNTHYRWIEGWMGCHSKAEMQAKARSFYQQWYTHVKRTRPNEKLLVNELGSGWEPLCEFLGKPLPKIPFPKVNETAEMNERVGRIVLNGIRNIAKKALVWVIPVSIAVGSWFIIVPGSLSIIQNIFLKRQGAQVVRLHYPYSPSSPWVEQNPRAFIQQSTGLKQPGASFEGKEI